MPGKLGRVYRVKWLDLIEFMEKREVAREPARFEKDFPRPY